MFAFPFPLQRAEITVMIGPPHHHLDYNNPMALKSTVYKAELHVSDLDRHYYCDHKLTLARHPSETDERVMVRLLAFALHADENLVFGNGLTDSDEADLWIRDLTGRIIVWIDVGLPEAKLIRKAAARAETVALYAYGRNADLWWTENRGELDRCDNLSVLKISSESTRTLAELARRGMELQCTIQDGNVILSDDHTVVQIEVAVLKSASIPGTEPYRR